MTRLTHIDVGDSAKVFAVLYALLGIIAPIQWAILSVQSAKVPIGFVLGPGALSLNFEFHRLSSLPGFIVAILCIPLLYGISGAITGSVLAFAFNLIGREILVKVQTEEIRKAAPVPFDI